VSYGSGDEGSVADNRPDYDRGTSSGASADSSGAAGGLGYGHGLSGLSHEAGMDFEGGSGGLSTESKLGGLDSWVDVSSRNGLWGVRLSGGTSVGVAEAELGVEAYVFPKIRGMLAALDATTRLDVILGGQRAYIDVSAIAGGVGAELDLSNSFRARASVIVGGGIGFGYLGYDSDGWE